MLLARHCPPEERSELAMGFVQSHPPLACGRWIIYAGLLRCPTCRVWILWKAGARSDRLLSPSVQAPSSSISEELLLIDLGEKRMMKSVRMLPCLNLVFMISFFVDVKMTQEQKSLPRGHFRPTGLRLVEDCRRGRLRKRLGFHSLACTLFSTTSQHSNNKQNTHTQHSNLK